MKPWWYSLDNQYVVRLLQSFSLFFILILFRLRIWLTFLRTAHSPSFLPPSPSPLLPRRKRRTSLSPQQRLSKSNPALRDLANSELGPLLQRSHSLSDARRRKPLWSCLAALALLSLLTPVHKVRFLFTFSFYVYLFPYSITRDA